MNKTHSKKDRNNAEYVYFRLFNKNAFWKNLSVAFYELEIGAVTEPRDEGKLTQCISILCNVPGAMDRLPH